MAKADWDTFPSHAAFLEFTEGWLDKLVPTLRSGGSLYVFNTPFNCAFILQLLLQRGLTFQNRITWDKRDGLGASRSKFSNGQETILFMTKGGSHTFNADAVRVPYESDERIKHAAVKGIVKNGSRWFPNPNGRLCGEVWHFSSERHKSKVNGKTPKLGHLTPKPLDLVERIVRASSNPGDLVLDCFMGSGTTAIAAKKSGRDFIGCEIDSTYIALARDRLKCLSLTSTP